MKRFLVKYSDQSDELGFSFDLFILNETHHINQQRLKEETLEKSFIKLLNRVEKFHNERKSYRREQNEQLLFNSHVQDFIKLFDLDNNEIALTTKNKDAWKENYKLKVFDQEYLVSINLPHIRKIVLPKLMIAQMPAIVKLELDTDLVEQSRLIDENSKIQWFHSRQDFNEPDVTDNSGAECSKPTKNKINQQAIKQLDMNSIEWILFDEGVNKKMCYLSESTENKLIKVVAIANDGKREGYAIEQVSSHKVSLRPDLNRFPMTQRHELTQPNNDDSKLRVISYNILVKAFSNDLECQDKLYSYCKPKYMDFFYRRILLLHEISKYYGDIVFLQECTEEFFTIELCNGFPNYEAHFKEKFNSGEGEAILFRKDRFKYIKSCNIVLNQEIQTNQIYADLWKQIEKNESLCKIIKKKGTILQLLIVEESNRTSGHHYYLLANTHFYYHYSGDFVRLLQSIITIKHIEKIKSQLTQSGAEVTVLYAGDFNSSPTSLSFNYMTNHKIPFAILKEKYEKELLHPFGKLFSHSLNLTSEICRPFTHCLESFEAILDYVFYETSSSLKIDRVVPLPPIAKIKENVALPSIYFPSDHLAIIFEFRIK